MLAFQKKTADDLDGLTHNSERTAQLAKESHLSGWNPAEIAHQLSRERVKANGPHGNRR